MKNLKIRDSRKEQSSLNLENKRKGLRKSEQLCRKWDVEMTMMGRSYQAISLAIPGWTGRKGTRIDNCGQLWAATGDSLTGMRKE